MKVPLKYPWAKHPHVTVKCSLCQEHRTLAQVEKHRGVLYWHCEGWHRLPKQLREERGESIPAVFACRLPLADVPTALPASAFAVICPMHHDPNRDFKPLGRAVNEAVKSGQPCVVFFP